MINIIQLTGLGSLDGTYRIKRLSDIDKRPPYTYTVELTRLDPHAHIEETKSITLKDIWATTQDLTIVYR